MLRPFRKNYATGLRGGSEPAKGRAINHDGVIAGKGEGNSLFFFSERMKNYRGRRLSLPPFIASLYRSVAIMVKG